MDEAQGSRVGIATSVDGQLGVESHAGWGLESFRLWEPSKKNVANAVKKKAKKMQRKRNCQKRKEKATKNVFVFCIPLLWDNLPPEMYPSVVEFF